MTIDRTTNRTDIGGHSDHMGNLKASSHTVTRLQAASLARDRYVELGWACLLAGLGAGLYSGSHRIELLLSIVGLTAVWLFASTKTQMEAVDWCMLFVGLYEIPAILLSQYRANGIATSRSIMLSVLLYFAVRLTIRTQMQIACLSGVYGLGGAGLAIFALFQFANNSKHLSDASLTNLLAFRSRLVSPPPPWILGEWYTILLLALPSACALSVYLWRCKKSWPAAMALIPAFPITLALTLSLSRAVFWSVGLFFSAACFLLSMFRVITFKKAALLLGSALGALFLILAIDTLWNPSVFEAYSGRHTSQVRSTEGRIAIWHRSLELVRAHPIWGVGSSNAALALTSTVDQEGTVGFASRTFSLPLQVLVEKGIIGLLLYVSFLLLVAREFILTMRFSTSARADTSPQARTSGPCPSPESLARGVSNDQPAHRAMTCCFAAGLLAVLTRELVYSSLLEHTLTLVLVAILCALLVRPEKV